MARVEFLLVVLLAACEPRVEEPSPPAKAAASDGAAAAARPSGPAGAGASSKPACVEPLGETPERTVTGPVPDPKCPADPGPRPSLEMGVVHFPEIAPPHANSATPQVAVEIAKKNADRMRGLMYRTELGENSGMLFVFEEERRLSFWMRNTCLPLDMIFISADGTIVGIEENTPTLRDDTFGPKCHAKYVLEVNAGWARKNGVRPGMKVDLPRN